MKIYFWKIVGRLKAAHSRQWEEIRDSGKTVWRQDHKVKLNVSYLQVMILYRHKKREKGPKIE